MCLCAAHLSLTVSGPQSAGAQVTEALSLNQEGAVLRKDEALGSLQQVQISPGKVCASNSKCKHVTPWEIEIVLTVLN